MSQLKLTINQENEAKEQVNALNEMFSASRKYRSSKEYINMLNFIARVPKYSPYNCFILQIQNPNVSYVATAKTWWNKFERMVNPEARPLVVIAPMQPVIFVYDLADTKGKEVPEDVLRPFKTSGYISNRTYENTIFNAWIHGIQVIETNLRLVHAGSAINLTEKNRKEFMEYNINKSAKYLILINKSYCLEDKYSSLVHELAHIFCGHAGINIEAWWKDRNHLEFNQREIEAESVSYLVCERKGLFASSDKYLTNYRTPDDIEISDVSIFDIFQSTYYIEEMSKSRWKKPLKKSIHKKVAFQMANVKP